MIALFDDFYANLPLFRNFAEVMDPRLFSPLPGDWVVGTADVVLTCASAATGAMGPSNEISSPPARPIRSA